MATKTPIQGHSSPHIGVDYNSKGVSLGVSKGSKVIATASLEIVEDLLPSFQLLKSWFANIQMMHLTCLNVYVEKPWMRAVQGRRGDTGLFTMRTATIVEIAVLEAGLIPVFVYPQTWRSVVYGKVPRGSDLKQLAIDYVQEELNYTLPVLGKTGRGSKPDHNIAEAICLSQYGNFHEGLETI